MYLGMCRIQRPEAKMMSNVLYRSESLSGGLEWF